MDNLGATTPMTNGDDAGAEMGVASGTVMGPSRHLTGAFTLLLPHAGDASHFDVVAKLHQRARLPDRPQPAGRAAALTVSAKAVSGLFGEITVIRIFGFAKVCSLPIGRR